jgi:glycosyltransferase involved in cell wall biosynthesis
MNLPPSSVIIASRNRSEMLSSTVKSILDGNEVPTEIIIVDQSDQPHTELAEMGSCRGCEVCYHWSQSVGTSKARNFALQMARYEHLVIIDDDLFVARDWLANLIGGLVGGGKKGVVSGKVLPAGSSDNSFTPSTRTDDEPARYEGRMGKDVLWSNNMAIHRSVIDEVGLFDERMGPGTPWLPRPGSWLSNTISSFSCCISPRLAAQEGFPFLTLEVRRGTWCLLCKVRQPL